MTKHKKSWPSRNLMVKRTMSLIQNWLETMQSIWINRDPDRIATILSKNQLAYYESPFAPPLTEISDVINVWRDIKNQTIESVKIDILYETDQTGIASWSFKEVGKPEITGCYYIELDKNGKCTLFRQWWMTQ